MAQGDTSIAILTGTLVAGLAAHGGGDVASFAAAGAGICARLLDRQPADPAHRRGRARRGSRSRSISPPPPGRCSGICAPTRDCGGRPVTSWFWLVGIVVLSLLPPLIKTLIGGNEDTVTAYLALFSIAVGAGSGLAAVIARGVSGSLPRWQARCCSAPFALDLGFAVFGAGAAALPAPAGVVFSSMLGLRVAIDLAGLAIAGGLFIVPAFAAVQAWSGADYRARTVAAINVLNAAFMTGATGWWRSCRNSASPFRPCLRSSAWRRCWLPWRSGRRCRRIFSSSSPRRRTTANYFFRIASTRSTISPATPR